MMIIPNIWKNKIHVPDHQSDNVTTSMKAINVGKTVINHSNKPLHVWWFIPPIYGDLGKTHLFPWFQTTNQITMDKPIITINH